eukprot:2733170-Lingulodinium_polyedra.AAC.1
MGCCSCVGDHDRHHKSPPRSVACLPRVYSRLLFAPASHAARKVADAARALDIAVYVTRARAAWRRSGRGT